MKTTARITRRGSILIPSARVSCAAVDVALAMCVQSYSLFYIYIYILASFNSQCFTRRRELPVYLKSWSIRIHYNYFAHVLICECKMCKKKKKREKKKERIKAGTQEPSSLSSELLLCFAACFCHHVALSGTARPTL